MELTKLESVIEKNLSGFYEVGHALICIRDKRLYRKNYQTFEEYCKRRWDFSIRHAERMMLSAGVVEQTRPMGRFPENERQARPLTKLAPALQKEAWQKAVETAPEGKVTAAHVNKIVNEMNNPQPKHTEPTTANEDSDALFNLKRWWKRTTRKDRKSFLLWINENQED